MDKRILNKIKQCLALAKSATNEHEAAAAMRAAQGLMRKYQVTDADIGLSCVSEHDHPIEGTRIVSYHALLLVLIEHAFGVKAVMKRGLFTPTSATFIGITPQPELAAYCYEVLWVKLKLDRSTYVKSQPKQCKRATKVARGDRYAEGWVNGVYHVVEEFALTEKQSGFVDAYVAKHYPNLTSTKPMTRGKKANTKDAKSEGYACGTSQSIHRPVNGQSQQKRLSRG